MQSKLAIVAAVYAALADSTEVETTLGQDSTTVMDWNDYYAMYDYNNDGYLGR